MGVTSFHSANALYCVDLERETALPIGILHILLCAGQKRSDLQMPPAVCPAVHKPHLPKDSARHPAIKTASKSKRTALPDAGTVHIHLLHTLPAVLPAAHRMPDGARKKTTRPAPATVLLQPAPDRPIDREERKTSILRNGAVPPGRLPAECRKAETALFPPFSSTMCRCSRLRRKTQSSERQVQIKHPAGYSPLFHSLHQRRPFRITSPYPNPSAPPIICVN